jgi:hypothetical protein
MTRFCIAECGTIKDVYNTFPLFTASYCYSDDSATPLMLSHSPAVRCCHLTLIDWHDENMPHNAITGGRERC